jgi:putative hydrolase of the HAD superfamily
MRTPTCIKAVFFDGYGTLLHAPSPVDHMRDELLRFGHRAPESALASALKAEMRLYREHCHAAHDEPSLRQLREKCAHVFMESIELQTGMRVALSVDDVVTALVRAFRFELFDDVETAIQALRSHACTLGVISNWDYRLPRIFDELGMGGAFDFVLTSAALGIRKPDPAIFRRALERASVDAGNSLHVGDDPEHDYDPARECGMRALLLDRAGAYEGSGRETIKTLAELEARLRA